MPLDTLVLYDLKQNLYKYLGEKYMNEERLRKIVEKVVGNNDPYWNVPVYNIVKQIINMPFDKETTISDLINYKPEKDNIDPLLQGQIYNVIKNVCKEINIKLESVEKEFGGLAYYYKFKKINSVLNCPICGEKLMYLMPDGAVLSCNKCNKYFVNENGKVGEETKSPYADNSLLY